MSVHMHPIAARRGRVAGAPAWALICGAAAAAPVSAQSTHRVSVGWGGVQGNDQSWQACISGNGRYVAFESLADNLVPDDTNGVQDVFVRDRWAGRTLRVSIASDGAPGNGESSRPSISHDGRFIAYSSAADNLVAGDANAAHDVFVHDLATGQTIRASVDSAGNEANGRSIHPFISADGSAVVFHSEATNLAPDGNPQWDVFVHDIPTGRTVLASVRTDGGWGNDWSEHAVLSGDGRLVLYHSDADNLIDGDTNRAEDIFLYDRATGVTSRVSIGAGGEQANRLCVFPSVAAAGRFVAFESDASNLVPGDTNGVRDIYVRDLDAATTIRVSLGADGAEPNSNCVTAAISRDGRYVAFASGADNVVPNDTNGMIDVFVRDLQTAVTVRVSEGPGGVGGNGGSVFPTISADGAHTAFQSGARNLVPGDTNHAFDIFVHRLRLPPTTDRIYR